MTVAEMLPSLREKWSTVPAGGDQRASSLDLLKLSDAEIAAKYDAVHARDAADLNIRGWYHNAYRPLMETAPRVLDIGCGFGISTIAFALMGARVTFTDIIPSNVELVRRVCRAKGIEADFHFIESVESYDALGEFDVVAAIGSLLHQPIDATREEIARILPHLKIGGRWLHFTYPKARWIKEGSPHFSEWGVMTDGEGTPWAEWYDLAKLQSVFAPAQMRLLLDCEWYHNQFNWFDLELLAH